MPSREFTGADLPRLVDSARANKPLKVAYIASWGRSGSTIISHILGELDGFFAAGELRFIWERGFLGNHFCGCAERFLDCPMWDKIIADAFGSWQDVDADRWNADSFRLTRTLQILRWIGSRGRGTARGSEFRQYLGTLSRLYWSIASVTGCRVIVDSSKFPMYGAILSLIPGVEVYFIHLVRDPRAVAYSWSHPKRASDDLETELTPYIGPFWSTVRWVGWNLAIRHLGSHAPIKYCAIRYEDFVAQPQRSVQSLVTFLGEAQRTLPFLGDSLVSLHPNHAISGNPGRFVVGGVSLRTDERWKSKMGVSARALVELLSLPMMRHYKYPVLGWS